MIEFNIQWSDGAFEELEDIVKLIKDKSLDDVKVNITRDVKKQAPTKKLVVPEMRMRQIVLAFKDAEKNGKETLTKAELVTLLKDDGQSPLSELTASVYISNASGCGLLNRTHTGYALTQHCKESYGG